MKKTNKRAFTIVELVIVIAVIAVLAAVLIPTFSGVVKKAKISADVQLAKNMNTALTIAESTDGKNDTFADAIFDIQEAGYTVEKLTPTSEKCSLVWDQDTDRIVFFDENDNIIYSQNDKASYINNHLWKVAHKNDTLSEKYSNYLANDFTGGTELTVKTGLDVGNKTIETINYVGTGSAQDVIIRTNGGTLTINAPADTVRHYGTALTVNVIAVADSTYNLFAKIDGTVNLGSGRAVIEATGEASTIIVDSSIRPEGVTTVPVVIANSGSSVGTIVVNTADEGTKIEVAGGAKVAAVAPGNDTAKNAMATIAPEVPADIKQEEVVDTTKASNFAGGVGTEASPYLISSTEQFLNVRDFNDEMAANTPYFFALANDIEVDYAEDMGNTCLATNFSGAFNGNNHAITIANTDSDDVDYILFQNTINSVVVKNLTMLYKNDSQKVIPLVYGWTSSSANLTFENVDMGKSGDTKTLLTKSNGGFYACFILGKASFINCNNYYNLTSLESGCYAGIYIGGYPATNATISFTDCTNYGTIRLAYAGMFAGNSQNYGKASCTVTNCSNEGYIYGSVDAWALGGKNTLLNKPSVEGLTGEEKIIALTDSTLSLTTNDDGYLVIGKASNALAKKYTVTFETWAIAYIDEEKVGSKYTFVEFTFENPTFTDSEYVTTLYSYKFMDKATYVEKGYTQPAFELQNNDYNYFIDNTNKIIVVDYIMSENPLDANRYTANSNAAVSVSIFDENSTILATKKK